MTDPDAPWDPQDGPPPTDDERDDARALGEERPSARDGTALIDTAHRVTATVHTDVARSRTVASSAVALAVARARRPPYRRSARWIAFAAAAAAMIAVGSRLQSIRAPRDEGIAAITHDGADVFDAPLPRDARSLPIDRIAGARMHAYRDSVLLAARSAR